MKLPWVSRALYEQTLADRDRERERYYELVASLSTPVRIVSDSDGVRVVAPAEPSAPDPIREVIREQADGDGRLAAHLRRYARELKLQGLNDDQIVGKLVEWQTSEAAIP